MGVRVGRSATGSRQGLEINQTRWSVAAISFYQSVVGWRRTDVHRTVAIEGSRCGQRDL
jgi:hypothetical protein